MPACYHVNSEKAQNILGNFELSRLLSESAETIPDGEVGVSDSEARGFHRNNTTMEQDIVRSSRVIVREQPEAGCSQHKRTETDLVFGQITFNAYIASSDLVLVPTALFEDKLTSPALA